LMNKQDFEVNQDDLMSDMYNELARKISID
jgi:hypothetical protein